MQFICGAVYEGIKVLKTVLGPISRKPRKLLGSVKPVLVFLYLKTEKCILIRLRLACMKGTAVHIKAGVHMNRGEI